LHNDGHLKACVNALEYRMKPLEDKYKPYEWSVICCSLPTNVITNYHYYCRNHHDDTGYR